MGGLEGAVVSAVGEEFAAIRFLVMGVHVWVDPIGNAGAVTLADCVRTCADSSTTTQNHKLLRNNQFGRGFHPKHSTTSGLSLGFGNEATVTNKAYIN